jgi:hypothetical protein
MQLKVQDIIFLAMSECGAVRINEVPAPYELIRGIQIANVMLDRWSGERLMLRTSVQTAFPLTAGVESYTIGTGQTFNTAKPLSIQGAFIRDNYGIDTPVEIVSRDRFDSYPDKSISNARPISLFYDPGVAQQTSPGVGTIWVYYTPDSYTPYVLYMDLDTYLTEFNLPTDVVTFEPVYYDAIVSNLAVRMFRHFHSPKVPIPPDMVDRAESSKRMVKALNSRPITAGMDIPGKAIGLYNIYTGQVNEY